jgi:hypothetical protein
MGVFAANGSRLAKAGVTTTAVSDPELTITQDLYVTRQYDPLADPKPAGSIYELLCRAGTVMRQSALNKLFPAATVAALTPVGGTTAGGTVVSLTGTNLDGATAVTVGGTAATALGVDSTGKIHFTTPAGAAGAKDVVVTTDAGTVTATAAYTYS